MNKSLKIIIFSILIISTSLLAYIKYNNKEESKIGLIDDTSIISSLEEEDKKINLDYLGISFSIPKELNFESVPNFNTETEKLDSYTFYIQKEAYDTSKPEEYFQMYGLMQFDIPTTTLEDLYKMKEDKNTYSYTKEIEINGVKGLEAQFSGQRNRYVYYLLLNDRLLTIAVSEATDANKKLAESILNTLEMLK
jgi:hypothetical protein